MGSVTKPKRIQLSCGHFLYYKAWLPEGDTLYCRECQEYVDVRVPPAVAVGETYHPDYDCTTTPITGKKGRYTVRCLKCPTWSKEASYHRAMEAMHQHQMNTHTRWGNPQLTLEGLS